MGARRGPGGGQEEGTKPPPDRGRQRDSQVCVSGVEVFAAARLVVVSVAPNTEEGECEREKRVREREREKGKIRKCEKRS